MLWQIESHVGMQGTLPPRRPRLLVCHDMAGGYGADAAVQGCGDARAFCLTHWHAVDAFVYFSHHLVTLPPPGWVHAAHRHAVPVRRRGPDLPSEAGEPSLVHTCSLPARKCSTRRLAVYPPALCQACQRWRCR